jgi:hypothetical protein
MRLPPPFSLSNWLEEKSKNRALEEKLVDLATYEVEVKTGRLKVRREV